MILIMKHAVDAWMCKVILIHIGCPGILQKVHQDKHETGLWRHNNNARRCSRSASIERYFRPSEGGFLLFDLLRSLP